MQDCSLQPKSTGNYAAHIKNHISNILVKCIDLWQRSWNCWDSTGKPHTWRPREKNKKRGHRVPIRSHAAGPSSNSSHLATNSSLPSIVNIRWNNVSFSVVIVNKHLSTYIDEKKGSHCFERIFFLLLLKCLPQKSVYGLLRIDLNKYRSGPIREDMMIFFPDCSSCNIKNRQCLFSLFFFYPMRMLFLYWAETRKKPPLQHVRNYSGR